MKKLTKIYILTFIIISLFGSSIFLLNNKNYSFFSNLSNIKIDIFHNNLPKPDITLSDNKQNNNQTKPPTIDELLTKMSLEEKIGQMLIIEYRKPTFDSNLKNLLDEVKPGGFILFSENFQTHNQTITLINNIKKNAKIPIFISIDQEGGRVQRLKYLKGADIKTIPSMSEIGASNNQYLAYKTGKDIGNDLNKYGINMNFAPVLDVYSNPNNTVIGERSFGNNAYLVSKMGIALAKGLKDKNIIPVYKHFPGHGNTETDSHYDLPIVNKTKKDLANLDLIPFIEAIKNNAEIIMVGHLAVPEITKDYTPASLSKKLITDFLKKELNYNNIVITDALNMKALTNNYSDKEIVINAIKAGVDILLMPNNPINTIKYIKDAIQKGIIKEEQINNSVKKILQLKNKYGFNIFS